MTTTATTLVPNFFLSEAIGALRKNQGLVRFISKDYSKEVAEKGKTVTIAKRGAMVIQDGVEGTAPVFQDTTDTPINITLATFGDYPFQPHPFHVIRHRITYGGTIFR